jgi:hypothetical protein
VQDIGSLLEQRSGESLDLELHPDNPAEKTAAMRDSGHEIDAPLVLFVRR